MQKERPQKLPVQAGTGSGTPKAGIVTQFLLHSSGVTKENTFQCFLDFINIASICWFRK